MNSFKLELERPLIILDIESTGLDVNKDRIVSLYAIKLYEDGSSKILETLFNPLIPIPKEVSLIHGITDDKIINAPTFQETIDIIDKFFYGCDLGGFNIASFDLQMIMSELMRYERLDVISNLNEALIVDVYKLYLYLSKRTLKDAYKEFLKEDMKDNHQAKNDVIATRDILFKMIEDDKVPNDVISLSKLNNRNYDFAGKFYLNKDNEPVCQFGKHKDQLLKDIYENDIKYLYWIIHSSNGFPIQTRMKLQSYINNMRWHNINAAGRLNKN